MIFVKIALALFLTTGVMPSWYADEASQVSESPQQIVRELASLYEVDPDLAVEMVRLECDWDQEAVGDSGKAVGPWQWHLPSWELVRTRMGLPVTDLREDWVESTVTALYAIEVMDLGRWWSSYDIALDIVQ